MNSHNTESKNNTGRSRSNLMGHLRLHTHWYLLFAVIHLAIFAYYWFEWRTLTDFVEAIDHGSQFMQDFSDHYYPMSRQILQAPTPVSGYYYTSFFALILTPISPLQIPSAMVIWAAIQIACLVTLCIVSARGLLKLSLPGMILYSGLLATSYPILHNLKWGQVSVLVTVCVIAAFLSANRHQNTLAGVLLAFATAIKFYPALFIVYFLLKRDIRTCAAFGSALFIFYLVFPATVLGFSDWVEFERATSRAVSNADWISNDVNSQYIVHVGLRWFAIIFDRAAGYATAQVLAAAGYLIALSCIAMAWLLQQRASFEKYGLSMVAIFVCIPFAIRTSWPHYFVYLPFCQAAVFSYYASSFRTSDTRKKVLCALPLLSMLLSSIFLFNLFPNWSVYNSYGMLFLANLLLLVAVYATITMQPDSSVAKRVDRWGRSIPG